MAVENAYETTFRRSYHLLSAQKKPRLAPCVIHDSDFTEGASFFVTRMGPLGDQQKQGRAPLSPNNAQEETRRRGTRIVFQSGRYVDEADLRRQITNPTSGIIEWMRRRHAYRFDREVVRALGQPAVEVAVDSLGNVSSTTEVALPTSQIIDASSTGLTFTKVLEAKEKLDAAEANDEGRYLVLGSRQTRDLLAVEQATSGDYVIKKLDDGHIRAFLGFQIIRSEHLDKVGNDRQAFAFSRNGMYCGSDLNIRKLRIAEDPSRSHTLHCYAEHEVGCLRAEEELVVRIDCMES